MSPRILLEARSQVKDPRSESMQTQ
jgi:hypothetical protein